MSEIVIKQYISTYQWDNNGIKDVSNKLDNTDGRWELWLGWLQCTASCGAGEQTRSRFCLYLTPQQGGKQFPSKSTEEQACQLKPCLCWTQHCIRVDDNIYVTLNSYH